MIDVYKNKGTLKRTCVAFSVPAVVLEAGLEPAQPSLAKGF
jgi:tRNA G18 (ribose-2'-O)-methylase SpoU